MTTSKTSNTVPTWQQGQIYYAGDLVTIGSVTYEANWWTEGQDPALNNGVLGTGEPWTIVSSGSGGSGSGGTVPSTPANFAVTATTSSSVTLAWSAAVVSGGGTVTGYAIFENGTQIATATGTTYTAAGLNASTAYKFSVAALDAAGASAQTTALSVSTPAGIIPTAPTGLTDSNVTATSLLLAWTAPTTPAGATLSNYTIFNNGTAVGTTSNTSFNVTGLSASTAYHLTVEASDQYGVSQPSSALSVTTPAGSSTPPANVPAWNAATVYTAGMSASENGLVYTANWWTFDNDPSTNSGAIGTGEPWTVTGKVNTTPTAPNAPTGLTATAASSTDINLSWTASTVAGSGTVSDYAIFENGKQIGTTTNTFYDAGSLTASTAYNFSVEAIDATGASPPSATASATTLAPGVTAGTGTFAPYIDMGLAQDDNLLAISQASGIKTFTLAFIQSSGTNQIGWGGVEPLTSDTLANGTSIQYQVQQLQAAGGNVIISFGGAQGTDPAAVATSAAALQAEYQSVINRYGVNSLDFDIEGAEEEDQNGINMRDQALVGLKAANPNLVVSFTLPVLPTGLASQGENILQSAKSAGLNPNVINIMAMDYGSAVDDGGQMGTDAISAALNTISEIKSAGLTSTVGVGPLIGVNDVSSEVFTLADAQDLVNFALGNSNITRLDMWSVARDNGSAPGINYDSPTASGIAQSTWQFSSIFKEF